MEVIDKAMELMQMRLQMIRDKEELGPSDLRNFVGDVRAFVSIIERNPQALGVNVSVIVVREAWLPELELLATAWEAEREKGAGDGV